MSLSKTVLSILLLLPFMTLANGQIAWQVQDANGLHQVKSHFVDPAFRNKTPQQIRAYLRAGCKAIPVQLSNGDYMIRSFVPGVGGGPILGAITAVVGTVATGVAAAGTFIAITATGHPIEGLVAGGVVGQAGMAATVYATGAAAVAPTP